MRPQAQTPVPPKNKKCLFRIFIAVLLLLGCRDSALGDSEY
jgi:hypothetical protein